MSTTIYISEEDLVENIQARFAAVYPFLSIEFFHMPHGEGEPSLPSDHIPGSTPIDDIRIVHAFGWLDISGNKPVAQVEKEFYELFGLSVQVFRQARHGKLETTRTDHLTLEVQNELGKKTRGIAL
ncbi:hypothetical protein GA0116948_11859 [Chitinophaga costaii]|uniref:Uncharacterized protein n=1 Tax=Chitinophaga costaii TaxID=1335309 RepID=A0A1C4FZG2_9BACT|nr:hypothetical protein [Chitinophaga costaii]SCC61093.1 hypothetical protein GA0116948_11859 [Chitinophaga costaii]